MPTVLGESKWWPRAVAGARMVTLAVHAVFRNRDLLVVQHSRPAVASMQALICRPAMISRCAPRLRRTAPNSV